MVVGARTAEQVLRSVGALSGLGAGVVDALANVSEVRAVIAGATLFAEGDAPLGLFVVRTGELKITRSRGDGKEQILYLARPGKPLVEGVRFDGKRLAASAVALRATSAVLVPTAGLVSVGAKHPELLRALIDLRAHRADRTLELVSDLSLRTVTARLASFLCALVAARTARGEDATSLLRDLTTETVASRLGTVREEISRALGALAQRKAIRVTPDAIEIRDLATLERVAYGARRS